MLRKRSNLAFMPPHKHAAFTLIEISIVLVIISLVIGGVVVGNSLYKNAQLTSIISDSQRIRSEIKSFKDTYQYYPGDFPNATKLWGAMTSPACDTTGNTSNGTDSITPQTTTCDGRGNGMIGNYFADSTQFATAGADMRELREKFYIWQHLSLANGTGQSYSGYSAVNGSNDAISPGVNVPQTGFSDSLGFTIEHHQSNKLSVDATRAWPVAGKINHLFSWSHPDVGINADSLLTSNHAENIDIKIDDGLPFSGKIFAHGREAGDPYGVSACTTVTDYNVNAEMPCGQYYRNFLED